MRKLFTYVTALCCAIFSVSTVKAADPSDGAKIYVTGTQVTDANLSDVKSDGKVSYDPAKHILTLNGVNYSSSSAACIAIDAAGKGYEVTIEVKGENYLSSSFSTGTVKMTGGDGLVIKGDKGASLAIVNSKSYSALQCAKAANSTGADLFPFALKGGMSLYLETTDNTNSYGALRCHHFSFDKSSISLRCPSGKTLYFTADASQDEYKKVMLVKNADNSWDGYAYENSYGVFINGVQMCDGLPQIDGMPSLTATNMSAITKGYAAYDAAKKTLILSSGFTMATKKTAGDGAVVGAIHFSDGTAKYTITTAGSDEVSVAASSGSNLEGLYSLADLTIDLNGNKISFTAADASKSAITFVKDLTISNSGDQSKVLYAKSSKFKGLVGNNSNSKVTINSTLIDIQGDGTTNASFSGVTGFTPSEDIMLASAFEFKAAQKGVCNAGTTTLATAAVKTTMKPKFTSKAVPAAGGSVVAKDGETALTLPYYHDADKSLTVTATANEGYKFRGWKKDGGAGFASAANPTPISITAGNSTTLDAWFGHTPKSDSPWFGVANDKWYTCAAKLQGNPTAQEDIESNINNAVYSDGMIYYVVYSGGQTGVFAIPFDGSNVNPLGKQTIVASQATYSYFDAFTYSENDDCFYAVADKGSDNYVIKIEMDGTITEIEKVTSTLNDAGAMAADADGNLLIFTSAYKLKKYALSTKTLSEVGTVDNLPGLILYAVMTIDPSDDALYLAASNMSGTDVYTIDPATAKSDWIWQMSFGSICRGLFTTAKSTETKYKITAKVQTGQEAMGSVSPTSAKKKAGEVVTLKAEGKPGYVFDKWSDGNKSNPRDVTVTKDETYIAIFKTDPDMYPIWVAGVQLGKSRPSMAKGTDAEISNGSIVYDDANKTITMSALQVTTTGTTEALKIAPDAPISYTIVVSGDCKLTAAGTAISLANVSDLQIECNAASDKLTVSSTGGDAIALKSASMTIYGMEMTVTGSSHGIVGTKAETVKIVGSTLSVKGTGDGSIVGLSKLSLKGCDMTSGYEFKNNQVQKSGVEGATKDEIKFTPQKPVTVKAFDEGSGTFDIYRVDAEGYKMSGDENVYTNTTKAWFPADARVVVEAKPASGFVFSHWDKDGGWKSDSKIPAKRDAVKVESGKDYMAYFYYKANSKATWFGIDKNNFISFRLSDYGKDVSRSKDGNPAVTDIQAGDFVKNKWIYKDGNSFKFMPNFKRVTDGEELKPSDDIIGSSSKTFTDMAYDIIGNRIFAVDGSNKLYKVSEGDGAVDEFATLQFKEVNTKVVAIAVDAKKKLYLLSADGSGNGVLYTADPSKVQDETLALSVAGEEAKGGALGISVDLTKQQSLAFDHATGELFWGNADYIRYINISQNKTFVAADIEQKEGAQGYIKSLHNLAKAIYISVAVEEDQDDWGTVSVEGEPKEAKVISKTNFTITATANEGYHFSHWSVKGSSKEIEENPYTSAETEDIKYIAVFAEGADGIESVTLDPSTGIQKVLMNGTIYIIRDGKMYDLRGALVR